MKFVSRFAIAIYASVLAAGLVGCGGTESLPAPVERLPGKWQGQMIVYEDQVTGKLPPEKIAELSALKMGFEFQTDGSMVLSGVNNGQAYSAAGRWEVVNQEGDLLTMKSTEETGETKNVNIEFDGSDTFFIPLKTEVAELGAMRFTRMR